jgi:hypothetical protein
VSGISVLTTAIGVVGSVFNGRGSGTTNSTDEEVDEADDEPEEMVIGSCVDWATNGWLFVTGPLLALIPIRGPVLTFFGQDCIGHGQLLVYGPSGNKWKRTLERQTRKIYGEKDNFKGKMKMNTSTNKTFYLR